MHIDSRVCKCCGAAVQSSGATARQTCVAPQQATRVEAPTDPHMRSQVETIILEQIPQTSTGHAVSQLPGLVPYSAMELCSRSKKTPPASMNNPSSISKEACARSIHCSSPKRAGACFEPVNWHVQLMQRFRGCHAWCVQEPLNPD